MPADMIPLNAASGSSSVQIARMKSPAARTWLFGAYTVCLLLAYRPVLASIIELSREDASASHLILIPFVALGLIWQRRTEIFSSVGFDWRAGPAVIALGLGCLLVTTAYRPADALSAVGGTFVVFCLGGFLLFYGRRAFRAAMFPLLFLTFMVPIPGVLLDGAVRVLTIGSSAVVAGLFTLTGTPYHREAFVFALPNLTIEVADACSGIRSTIALLLTALLAGHMYLQRGWSKALLVIAILPVTILKNGIRIVTLSLLSVHVDPSFLEGRLHHDGGVVFFLLALGLLAPVLMLLRRAETSCPSFQRSVPERTC